MKHNIKNNVKLNIKNNVKHNVKNNVKHNILGVLSGIFLFVILALNTVFVAVSENKNLSIYNQVSANTTVDLPVIMYHHIMEDPKRWGDYVISPADFEKDLKYIQKQGYTVVSIAQVLDYYENKTPLPKKPILLTFDDGYETVFEYAFPLLQKYKMSAVLSIIGKYADLYSGDVVKDLSYSHANWEQLNTMLKSGNMEIGNHTYDLHHCDKGDRLGIKRLDGESLDDYTKLLDENILAFNKEIEQETGISPYVFAYPFGALSKDSDKLLLDYGFKIALTCEEKVNKLSNTAYDNTQLIKLKRFNRAYSTTVEDILSM